MPFEEYVTTPEVVETFDESILGKLLARTPTSTTWDRKALERIKRSASDLFESHASNVYDVPTELRTDPVPAFAKLHVLNIIRYFCYSHSKRHQVPTNVEKDYLATMEVLEAWGKPQILDADGVVITASSVVGSVSYHSEELEFEYYTVARKLWG